MQEGFGSADALRLRDVKPPVPGAGEVLIRVRAAGCGPDVWHLITGLPYFVRVVPQFRKLSRGVRGRDAAGTVEAVGSNVTEFNPGDQLMGIVEGSFAELAVGRADKLVPKPERLTFEQAAAVPISGITAVQAIHDEGKAEPGQRILVVGAAGGVGTLAVQVAKAAGAHVTGVCSSSKGELVRSIGADDVIDYTREDFADGNQHWDLIVDTAGRRSLSHLRRALTPKGTLVIVGGEGGNRWTGGFFRGVLRAPLFSLLVGQRLLAINAEERKDTLVQLAELIERGEVTPVIDRSYPLADAAEAVRHLEEGHAAGKIVVII